MATHAKKRKVLAHVLIAQALAAVAEQGEKIESTAGGMLQSIRDGNIRTIEAYDDAVKKAYEVNGWHVRRGKPTDDRRLVPGSVRTYVWELRAAFKDELPVWTYKTFYEMRLARKKIATPSAGQGGGSRTQASAGTETQSDLPALVGVRMTNGTEPNGGLFHDMILLYMKLSTDARTLLERNLSRLLHRYQTELPPPAQVAESPPERKRSTG